jgi:hypothetical protein
MTFRGSVAPLDRLYGCLPYLLPMSAAVIYGFDLFQKFPVLVYPFIPFILLNQYVLALPLVPLLGITGELVVMICLYFFVIRDSRIARFARFNTIQALLLQVVLFIFQVVFQILRGGMGNFITPLVSETLANTLFLGMYVTCGYAIYRSAIGLYSELPGISEAASIQCDR